MYCPKCRTLPLKQAAVKEGGGVQIEYCPQCKGFWLNEGEFEKVSEAAIKDLSLPPDAKKVSRICPVCQELMFEFHYPQTYVTVDMCRSCDGLWIDAGELKEIEAIRTALKSKAEFREYDDVRGVKGALLNFVDAAIDYLKSC